MLAVAPRKALLLTTGHIALLRASAAAADDYHSQWRVRIGEVQSVKGDAASPAVDRLLSARRCSPVCCQRLESCGSGHCRLKIQKSGSRLMTRCRASPADTPFLRLLFSSI